MPNYSAKEMLLRMAHGGPVHTPSGEPVYGKGATAADLLAAEQRILGEIAASPDTWDVATAYNAILESGVTVEDALAAGVQQSTIDAIFTSGAPLPVTAFSTPSTVTSAFESAPYAGQSMEQIRTGAQNYVSGLMADGLTDAERREAQAVATQQGATFQDMLAAGVDPSILFNVPAAKEPDAPINVDPQAPVVIDRFPQTQTEYVPPTVYQPIAPQPDIYAPGEEALDREFRDSPPRTEVTEDVMGTQQLTGFDYTPAAKLLSATGSGFSFTPPSVTSRPRSLMDTNTLNRYTQGRSAQDLRQLTGGDQERYDRYSGLLNNTGSYGGGLSRSQLYALTRQQDSQQKAAPEAGSTTGTISDYLRLNGDIGIDYAAAKAAGTIPAGTTLEDFGFNHYNTYGRAEIAAGKRAPFTLGPEKKYYFNTQSATGQFGEGDEESRQSNFTTRGYDNELLARDLGPAGGAIIRPVFAEGGLVKKPEGFADGGPADSMTADELTAQLMAMDTEEAPAPVEEPRPTDQVQTESQSMLDNLNRAMSQVTQPVVAAATDMTVGLGDLAQMGVKAAANKMGIETKPFIPVGENIKASLGADNVSPLNPIYMATQILPFAKLQKALAAGPAAYREAMAYLAGEGGAQVAATQFPDSMAAQLAGAVTGDMSARGILDTLDGRNVRRITGDEPPIDDGPLPEGEPEGTVLGISDQSESGKMLETLRPEITTEIGDRKRVGTTGQYVGAPEGVNNPQKLAALTKSMTNLTKEGEFGRFWYERSGRQILDITGGNKADAEKIIQAVAITSANTPVASNFDFAVQAYYQWKNGQPIKTGMYTTAMSKKLQKMFEGEDWAGRKTNNFYNNLMREVDPSKVQGVTTDLWMMRAFGFDKDAPTSAQYSFVENETKRIAENLGWEPQQVQASIWVALKSRMENQGVKDAVEAKSIKNGWMHYETIKGKKVRVIDDKNKHAANWLDQALKYSPTDADRAAAGFDYADAANNNLAQISWETIPSRTSGHMPEIFETTPEIKQDYHVQMSKAFLDDNGNDLIAQQFEILSPGDFEAPGYFEGLVSPGTQTEITVPRQYGLTRRTDEIKKQAKANARPEEAADLVGPRAAVFEKETLAADLRKATYATEPAARESMFAYAAARGILLKQDGVGLHRPAFINGLSRPKSNGIEINIGRPLTARETSAIAKAVAEEAGHTEFNPIGSPNGARFINFDYMGLPNVQFQKLVNKALEKVTFDNNETVDAAMFGADTGYLGNDWTENLNGEGYLETGELAGRPDLQRKIRDIVAQLAPRVSAVEDEFSNRYNWTRNRNLNSTYENAEALAPQSLTPDGPEAQGIGSLPTNAAQALGYDAEKIAKLPRVVNDPVAQRFNEQVGADPEAAIAQYRQLPDSKGGKVLNTDIFRELNPEYRDNRTLSSSVQETSNALNELMYQRALRDTMGQDGQWVFTGGGAASGKSAGLSDEMENSFDLVVDGTLANFEKASTQIDQALDSGKAVTIVYVDRPPEKALPLLLKRAGDMENELGSGRTVPLDIFLGAHRDARESIKKIDNKYKNDNRVAIEIVNNHGAQGEEFLTTVDNISEMDYNTSLPKVTQALEDAYEHGKISESIYLATKGNSQPRPESTQRQASGANTEVISVDGQQAKQGNQVTALNKSGEPLGINIAVDKNGTDYADLIVSGTKKFESRETASLKPYVGKRVGIVRTGAGPAEVIGSVEIGQPIEVNEKQFNQLRDQHLVAEDSSFNIKKGQTKFLYPMMNPISTPTQKVTSKGIVARALPAQKAPTRKNKVTFEAFGGSLGDARQKLGITPEKIEQFKAANKGTKQEPVPKVMAAAKKLKAGEISTEEYNRVVEEFQPIKPLGSVQKRPTNEQIAMALAKREADSAGIVGVNLNVPDGTMISSRLDIPAYENMDTWVVTLHDGTIKSGLAVGYAPTAVLNDVEFYSNAAAALKMATKDTSKGTIARINGSFENRDPAAVEQLARDILDGTAPDAKQWVEVGMNPFRHSYFYRKSDGMPVANAEQVIQVGPLVLAKKVKTRPVESPEHLVKSPKGERYFKSGGSVERVYNDNRTYK